MTTLQQRLANLSPEQREALLHRLGGASPPAQAPTQQAERDDRLSPSQLRMWMFEKIQGDSTAYNIGSVLRLHGALDTRALEAAINDIVRRHESLRTVFREAGDEVRMVILPHVQIPLEETDLSGLGDTAREAALTAAIDQELAASICLASGPLLRIRLLRLAEDSIVLTAVIHHIAADGWSLRVLERELSQGYLRATRGQPLDAPVPDVQYRDYVGSQRLWLERHAEAQLAQWRRQLDGAPTCWPMPVEAGRVQGGDLSAATTSRQLPADLHAAVLRLAEAEQASIFMVMATAFHATLSLLAGTSDLSFGTPVAGRREARFDGVIGLFANTVALRPQMPQGSFRQALAAMKSCALTAFSHQDVPFEQVVDALRPERSGQHPPLFQVLFALQATEQSELVLPGLEVSPVHLPRRASEFDLILELFLSGADNHVALTHRTALFAEPTAACVIDGFIQLLSLAVKDPDQTVRRLQEMVALPATAQGVRHHDAAALLAAHCALASTEQVMLVGDLDPAMETAAHAWAQRCVADVRQVGLEDAEEALQAAGGGVLVMRPQDAMPLSLSLGRTDISSRWHTLVVHGGCPGGIVPVPGRSVWQAWTDGGNMCVLQRAGGSDALACGTVDVVNSDGAVLPDGAVGELVQRAEDGRPTQRTGLRGRRVGNGIVATGFPHAAEDADVVLASDAGRFWIDGVGVDPDRVRQQLERVPGVQAAAVVARRDAARRWRLIAYVVPTQKLGAVAAYDQWVAACGASPVETNLVAVNRLPLATHGRLNGQALAALPVLDADTRARVADEAGLAPEAVDTVWRGPPAALPLQVKRPGLIAAGVAAQALPPSRANAGPAALSCGAPLALPHCEDSLVAMLDRAAERFGDHGITYIEDGSGDGGFQSYRELRLAARTTAMGLRGAGLQPGQRVLIQLGGNRDMVLAFWACVLSGAQPIMVGLPASAHAADKDVVKLVNAWPAMAVSWVISNAAHQNVMDALAAGLGEERVPLLDLSAASTAVSAPPPEAGWHRPEADDVALLLLTSGSTGVPKAVMQSHRALIARSASAVQQFGFTADMVSLNWMPLDHVGGLVMLHLQDIYVGGNQIQVAPAVILERPTRWIEWLSRYRVNLTWAPNFAYALVNDLLEGTAPHGCDLGQLQFVLNGGESVVPRTARSFLRTLSACGLRADAMFPVWGMSETSSGSIFNTTFRLSSSQDSDAFLSVGQPMPGLDVRIVDGQDHLVAEGEEGRLQVRGAMVTSGYFNNEKATRESFTADGWYVTGDLAIVRAGAVTITGREKDVIIINGANHSGHEIEQVVERVEDIPEAHVAACGVRRDGDNTDRLAIFYCVQARAGTRRGEIRAEIGRRVLSRFGVPATYLIEMEPDELPRTSIGKIQRPQLAQRFNAGEFDARLGSADARPEVPAWFHRPSWKAEARDGVHVPDQAVVVVGEDAGFCAALAHGLRGRGLRAQSSALLQEDEGSWLDSMRAWIGGDPIRLVYVASTDGGAADGLDPGAVEQALQRLVALVQGIWSLDAGQPVLSGLDIVTRCAVAATGQDVPALAQAGLGAWLRSAAQEQPRTRCRQIDTDADPTSLQALVDELAVATTRHCVALRHGRRLVQVLQDAPAQRDEHGHAVASAPEGEGMCVVTGGLGGVGRLLCEWLLQHSRRRVRVVVRTHPEAPDAPAQLRAEWQALRRHGDRIDAVVHDLARPGDLHQLLMDAEDAHGAPLREVFHLAGSYHEVTVTEQTPASLRLALAAKVGTALALHRSLAERKDVDIIHFGSVNGYFGGASVSAYAAANGLLHELAAHRRHQGGRSRCLAWSMWDETGMSEGHGRKPLLAAKGFAVLTPAQALDSLGLALAADMTDVVIGLDPTSPNIARHVDGPLWGWWHLAHDAAPAQDHRDAFGVRFRCVGLAAPANGLPVAADRVRLSALEAQLAAIWQEVLRTPVDSADANFFELGGDSIMAIQVVARAGKAGVVIAPRALFECQTLAELAASVGNAVQIRAEQGVLHGSVPLSPTQAWFFSLGLDDAWHMNQSVLLKATERLDPDRLGQALSALVRQHDMLRARFAPGEGGVAQVLVPAAPVQVAVETLHYHDTASYITALETVCSRVQASMDLAEGPLLQAVQLLGRDSSEDRVLLAAHHLVTDGVSWRILVEDLESLLCPTGDGQPPTLPAKSSSYRQWVEAILADACSESASEELVHWTSLSGLSTVLPPRSGGVANLRGEEASFEVELDAEATAALLQRVPAVTGMKVEDLLLTALQQAHAAWTGSESLYLVLEGHGRDGLASDLDVSRTVGWFTSVYPLALNCAPGGSMLAAAARVARQRAAVPSAGRRFNALRLCGNDAARRALTELQMPQISFNYLGRFEVAQGRRLSFASEAPGTQISPRQQRLCEIDVVGAVLADRARFSFIHAAGRYHRADVQQFGEAFVAALERLIQEAGAPRAQDAHVPDPVKAALAARPARPGRIERIYPATPMQTALIYDASVSAVDGAYVSQLVNELTGTLDPQCLRDAWQGVLDRHDTYRTGFIACTDGRFYSIVDTDVPLPWEALDWCALDAAEQETRFAGLLESDARRGFDIASAPLIRILLVRLGDERYRMLLTEHHAVSDGWSRGIVLAEVGEMYKARAAGTVAALPAARSFQTYVDWLADLDRTASARYWRGQLQGLALPTGYAVQPPAPGTAAVSGRLHCVIGKSLTSRLSATAREQRVTLSSLVQAAWSLVMAAHSGCDDIAFLTTHAGRPAALVDVERIVGPFIQSVPVRVTHAVHASVAECARALQSLQVDREEHGHLQVHDICALAGRRDLLQALDTFFVFENFPLTAPEGDQGGLRVASVTSIDRAVHPLMVMVIPGDAMQVLVYYRGDRFDAAGVEMLLEDFRHALEYATAEPGGRLHPAAWLPEERLQAMAALRVSPVSAPPTPDRDVTTTYEF